MVFPVFFQTFDVTVFDGFALAIFELGGLFAEFVAALNFVVG